MRWKIYYGDGSIYSSDDGPPEDAPGTGLQVIVQLDKDHGRHIVKGGNEGRRDDYYWWDFPSETWWVGDYPGFLDYLMQPGVRKVIFGRSIPSDRFAEIYKTAVHDPDFPVKTGWRQREKL